MIDFFMVDVSVTGGLVKTVLNALAVLLVLSFAPSAHAGFVVNTLGAAGPSHYALLALGASPSGFSPGSTSGTTDLSINGPCGAGSGVNCISGATANVTGNVGMADPNGVLSPNASSGFNAIDGNLYLAASAASNPINGDKNQINGNGSGIFYSQDLSAANTAAFNASTTFAGLAASAGKPTTVNGTATINAVSGSNTITVLDLTSFNLGNGQILTLNGSAGDQFVINVSASNFSTLQGKVVETGGVTADDVVINVTGTGQVNASGGGNSAVINGILLAPVASIGFAPGLIEGELIAGGQSIHLVSGMQIVGMQATPEPAYGLLLLSLLGAFGVARRLGVAMPRLRD